MHGRLTGMKDSYVAALLEEIRDQVRVSIEAIAGVDEKVTVLSERVDAIEEVVADIPVIKAAVLDITKEIKNHDGRIGNLELRTTRLERNAA